MNTVSRVAGILTLTILYCPPASPNPAQGDTTTVHVAANGTDTSPCGSPAQPCRSITFGLQNAVDGATVLVGPGRYGDLNGDGLITLPGEELGEIGHGCQCLVNINRPVRIVSTHGAAATVIDASGFSQPTIPVWISADGVRFGIRDRGFLVKAPPNYVGVYVFAATGVTVAGNIATGGATGFFIDGGSGNLLQRNISYGNIVGVELRGTKQVARLNYASGNVSGFAVYATDSRLTENLAISNEDAGFLIAGSVSNVVLAKNLATGNLFAGFRLEPGGTPVITGNNIYGNGSCGIFNRSKTTINATRNYWGAASGPGPDPADDVCNDERVDITVTTPFAKRPIPVPNMTSLDKG